jgi:hypothetical protein
LTPTQAQPEFRLLVEFGRLFEQKMYRHRASNQGDLVAIQLYEDLIAINRSSRYVEAVLSRRDRVLNTQNRTLIPGCSVARGPIATVEIGVEVKILAKAMIKQIDRVISDLSNQVTQFRRGGGDPICVAVVGINHAEFVVGYEGDRPFPTTGRGGFVHPIQEAAEAERRLREHAQPSFDEFVILRFRATNATPFPFEWLDYHETRLDYSAALTRISSLYQRRF